VVLDRRAIMVNMAGQWIVSPSNYEGVTQPRSLARSDN
jgi:hypothetical protein